MVGLSETAVWLVAVAFVDFTATALKTVAEYRVVLVTLHDPRMEKTKSAISSGISIQYKQPVRIHGYYD
jgi:hypothetical protein